MLEKFHLRGENQDPGDPWVGKVRGGGGFFFLQAGGGLTLDDTMNIKIRCMGKCTGKSYGEIGIYRTWLVFSNISKFVFFRN